MKKAIALGLSLIMSVTMLCSCSKDDDSSSSGKRPDIPSNASVTLGEEIETDERKLVALEAKINSSGEQTVLMDSTDSEISLYFYTTHSGNKIYTQTVIAGNEVAVLSNDGGTYVLDNKKKRYYHDDMAIPETPANFVTSQLSGSTSYLGTYKVTINGANYICEKYKDETGFTYFVFFDDGSVVAQLIQLEEGGEIGVIPTIIAAEANDKKLKLPDDYKKMTEEEYVEYRNSPVGVIE